MEEAAQYWEVEAPGCVFASPPAVIESIRRAAMAGLQKIPKRGLEVGGVLFGLRLEGRTVIRQWREVLCEHAIGPGFDLSSDDEDALRRLLEESRHDPELGQLEVVGWFRTRTRGEARLEEADIDLHERFFPEPSQFLMVIRPFLYDPARGCIFGAAGRQRLSTAPLAGFELANRRAAPRAGFDPNQRPRRPVAADPLPWTPARAASPGPAAANRGSMAEMPAPPGLIPAPYPSRAARVREAVASVSPRRAALTTVLAAAAIVLLTPAFVERDTALNLRVEELASQLLLQWNPRADALNQVGAALLMIQEGAAAHRLRLGPEELRSGNFVYERAGGDTEFHLTLHAPGKDPVTEIARFVGGAPEPQAAPDPEQAAAIERLEDEARQLRSTLAEEETRAEALRAAIGEARRRIEER